MLKPISIKVANGSNFAVERQPFSIGIPFPMGELSSSTSLKLDCNGQVLSHHVTPLAYWPDDSVKWLLLDFQASVSANDEVSFQLLSEPQAESSNEIDQVIIQDIGDKYQIDTGPTEFTLSKSGLGFFDQVVHSDNKLLSEGASCVQLHDDSDNIVQPTVTAINISDSDNRLRQKITIDGFFQNNDEHPINFNLILNFYAGLSTVKSEFTLLNPRPAEHTGGIWDLGDSGSFFFKALSLKIQLTEKNDRYETSVRVMPDADWQLSKSNSLSLEQYSSGGENWQSKNHMNYRGEIPLQYKGFRYIEQNIQVDSGSRAEPVTHLTSGESGITAHIVNFWQNFPKGLAVDNDELMLNLFPGSSSECYELQGGERKKHVFYLDFGNNRKSLDGYIHEIAPQISLECYVQAKVIPWLPASRQESMMQKLIDRGIEGKNNFFEKRETIDEFGWRNFGEIFADHEELEYKGNEQLISHYNNQYDPVYGFIKQYLISGDSRWYELLSDLARHVVDIDIYHTIEDRGEYNGGLFWHTHHYLNAFTCSHRTFSRHHIDDFLYGEIGGGPGTEHCYTTGFSYFYYMTGDEVYKEAALQLTNWMTRVFEGSGTLIERVFQFKSKELPILKRLMSGEAVQRYKYPFTRGTGNYITSLIDAYNLTRDRHYLSIVEKVIHQSIHPHDDISLRQLDQIETSWSYLVYLQAICKYLDLKISLQEIDDSCLYAKDALLHYVDWMLENESPFLQSSENLESVEYPNHTWTAQDLRKANLFYIASLYSEDKKDRYLEAARHYVQFVEDTLAGEETRYYSRILILLMQNDLQESSLDYAAAEQCRKSLAVKPYSLPPRHSVSGILYRFFKDIGSGVFRLSIKEEKRWLSFRMK